MQNDTDRRYRETLANGVLTGDRPIFDTGSMFGQIDRDGVDQLPQPIMLYTPITGRDEATGEPTTFVRGSQAVRPDGMLIGNNIASIYGEYNQMEGSATSYYCQTYTTSASGIITTDAPITRTVTLPSTGAYVLWIEGNASLSVTVAAGTAVGSGWGSLTASGYLPLIITTAGTVTVTVMGGEVGDQVQLTTGAVKTSYIPTPTTTPVTRASSGADTSGNGLSIPLSQAMVDSLVGELLDGTSAWTHVSGTGPAYSGGNRILTYSGALTSSDYHALNATLAIGKQVEVRYAISGHAAGSVALGFGSAAGATRTSNGTYTERGTLTGNTNFYVNSTGFTGVVEILSIRRVLDSGQVNPGSGTVLCGVWLPWCRTGTESTAAALNVCTANNTIYGPLYFYFPELTPQKRLQSYDGINIALLNFTSAPGLYALISQFSARTSQMRVGLYNPATGTLTWGSWAAYRGFFPIYGTGDQQRLRFFYGGGSYPVGIGPMLWYNAPIPDDQIIWAAREVQP